MKKWFSELPLAYKTAFVTTLVVVIAFLALLFGYFIGWPGLPNGILLGGTIGIISYLLMGITDKYDMKKDKPIFAIIITVVRYLFIAGAVVLAVYLQYRLDNPMLNVFTVVGAYTASLLVYLVLYLSVKQDV